MPTRQGVWSAQRNGHRLEKMTEDYFAPTDIGAKK